MKYEIIKGSEKDFEGAPDWATLRTVGDSGIYFFVEAHAAGMMVVAADGIESTITQHQDIWPEIIAERRPITEPVAWLNLDECDGSEYLGPVIGKEMECHAKDGSIFVVVVVAFDGDLPIVKTRLHGNYFGCDPSQLKPIPSPEDVARDEAITALFNVYMDAENNDAAAKGIYDAIEVGKIPGVTKIPTVSELMRVTENATREDCEAIVKMLSGK